MLRERHHLEKVGIGPLIGRAQEQVLSLRGQFPLSKHDGIPGYSHPNLVAKIAEYLEQMDFIEDLRIGRVGPVHGPDGLVTLKFTQYAWDETPCRVLLPPENQ